MPDLPDAAQDREALRLMADALEVDDAQREAWLQLRTAGRPSLAARVRALLAADAETAATATSAWPAGDQHADGRPPPAVGPWALVEWIGAGGMGSVYRAERDDGLFEQTVAIKFVRGSVDHETWRALIDAERRTLARMAHPGIARLLDAGFDPGGRPYLVMEFVDGVALDEHCAAHQLSLAERVRLVRAVCDAVVHAHGHLVLHCDLKPANVLVTAQGRPVLIDFGVARWLGATPAAHPDGMTRAYSSPQRLAGEPPGTADEVFALGVMLRELVDAAPGGRAQAPADLKAVVACATAPERASRYPRVDLLDAELGRWLEHRPVQAMGGGWRYRVGRLARRRPWATGSAALATVATLAALVAITVLYERADRAREAAEARFSQLRAFANFVLFDLDERLATLPGATAVRRDMVEQGQRYLDGLARTAGTDATLLREVALGAARLAEVQGGWGLPNVGERRAALANLDRARDGLLAVLQRQPADWTILRDLGRVELRRADLIGALGNDEQARLDQLGPAHMRLSSAWQAVREARSPVGADDLAHLQSLLAEVRLKQAAAHDWLGRSAQGLAIVDEELARLQALPAGGREHPALAYRLAQAEAQRGDVLFSLQQFEAALDSYRRSLDRHAPLLAARPGDRTVIEGLLRAHWGAADALLRLGRGAESAAESAAGLDRAEQLARANPGDASARHWLGILRTQHAQSLGAIRRTADAVALLDQELGEREAWRDLEPDDGDRARTAAVPLRMLAQLHWRAGQTRRGCEAAWRAAAAWAELDRRFGLAELDRRHEATQLAEQRRRCGR